MSRTLLTISVASTILFALVVLTKLGFPLIVSALLAAVAGFVWWQYERNENENEKPGVADAICAVFDIRDILKYINRLFF